MSNYLVKYKDSDEYTILELNEEEYSDFQLMNPDLYLIKEEDVEDEIFEIDEC